MSYNFKLFNAVTDAIELLKTAQQNAEESLLSEETVFFWCSASSGRCGLVQAEDVESALEILFGRVNSSAIELKCLSDGESFYEADYSACSQPCG